MDIARAIRRLQLHAAYVDDQPPELAELLRGLLQDLDPLEQRALLRHAYWRMPEVSTAALRLAAGGDDLLLAMAGRGPVTGSCRSCGRIVRARDRDDDDGGEDHCAGCQPTRVTPRPAGGAAAPDWEFTATPTPWQPSSIRLAAGARRVWAEHYPRAGSS
jgi:hypothetical protein